METATDQNTSNHALMMPRWLLIITILSVVVGGFFRFYLQSETALANWDESFYHLAANTFVAMPQWWLKMANGIEPREAWNQVYTWGFKPHLSFKPAFLSFFIFAKALSGGATPSSGLWLSPVLGLATLYVIYKLMRTLGHSQHLAAAAMVLCSIGGIPILYSRMLYPHQFAALALATWLWWYLKQLSREPLSKRRTIVLGLSIGALLSAHDMMLPIVVLLTLVELGVMVWRAQDDDTPSSLWKIWQWPSALMQQWPHVSMLLLGVIIPTGFWELVIIMLRKFLHRTLHKGYVMPYHQELLHHVTGHKVTTAQYLEASSQMDYLYFFKVFGMTEGWLFVVMLVVGLGVLVSWVVRPKSPRWTVFAIVTLACFGMVCAFHDKMLRLVVPFYPLLWVTAVTGIGYLAYGVYWLFEVKLNPSEFSAHRWPQSFWRWAYFFVVLILFVQMGTKRLLEPFWLDNGLKTASAYMTERLLPGESIATPYRVPVYTAYLQQKVYRFRSQEQLDNLIRTKNVRWVLFDLEKTSKMCTTWPELCSAKVEASHKVDTIEANMDLYLWKTIPNDYSTAVFGLLERHWTWDAVQWAHQNAGSLGINKVRIYWIPAPSTS